MTEMNYYLLKLEMVAKFYVCSIQVEINGIYVFGLWVESKVAGFFVFLQ